MGKYKDTHGYSRFSHWLGLDGKSIGGVIADAGQSLFNGIASVGGEFGNQLNSFINSFTGAHLTGQQVEANEMQMQNVADQYGKSVEGMQAAGLNPALMYKSGATSAPSVAGQPGTGSMSDLMQLAMLPLNKKLLQAEISNTNADTSKKYAETENIQTLTPAQYKELVSKIELNNKGLSEADARIAADFAQAALYSKNTEWYDALSGSQVALNEAYEQLADAQSKHNEQMVKESEQKIRNLKQEVVESASRCVVNAANAGYLDQATCNLLEEQGLIEVRRAGERVEYMLNDKILQNYDVDKWFNRWQQGTAGLRDIGITYGSLASGGLFTPKPRSVGFGK